MESVNSFCYVGIKLKARDESEAAVAARARIGWMQFKKCGELLRESRLWLKIKRKTFSSCVRSVMSYESETWRRSEDEKTILRRIKKTMIKSMCGI